MLNVLKQIGKSICYVGLYFGLQLLVSIEALIVYEFYLIFQMAAQGINPDAIDQGVLAQQLYDASGAMTAPVIVIAGALALVILWLFFKLRRKKFAEETHLVPFDAKFWPAVLLGSLGLCLFVNFGMQLLPIPEEVLAEYAAASEGLMEGPLLLLFMSNVIMAPLIEEILFRGLVFTRLQKAMPVWGALILSSFFFGLMHGQILWVCYTTLVGVVLGFAAWRAKSTLAPMFMHFAFNLFGTCLGYFVESVTGLTSLVLTGVGVLCLAVTMGLLWRQGAE